MGTLVRLYVGWRLLRLLRPILGAAAIAALLALHGGHVAVKGSASSPLVREAVAAQRDISRAQARLRSIAALMASDQDCRDGRRFAVADSA